MKERSTEEYRRKIFQRVKGLSLKSFWEWFNTAHTNAYKLAQQHYGYAMDMELTAKQKAAIESRVKDIRELWDNIDEVTVEQTGTWGDIVEGFKETQRK